MVRFDKNGEALGYYIPGVATLKVGRCYTSTLSFGDSCDDVILYGHEFTSYPMGYTIDLRQAPPASVFGKTGNLARRRCLRLGLLIL